MDVGLYGFELGLISVHFRSKECQQSRCQQAEAGQSCSKQGQYAGAGRTKHGDLQRPLRSRALVLAPKWPAA